MNDRTQSDGPSAPRIVGACNPDAVMRAVEVLVQGGIVVIPTDTVYGIVARYDDDAAVRRIFEIKGRKSKNPLPVLIVNESELSRLCLSVPEEALTLARRFWPGALTMILQAKPTVSTIITAGTGNVGCRVPADSIALAILSGVAQPLASSSANRSGAPPASTGVEVASALGPAVDLILEKSKAGGDVASTVIDLTTSPFVVRRRGMVSLSDVRQSLSGATVIELLPD